MLEEGPVDTLEDEVFVTMSGRTRKTSPKNANIKTTKVAPMAATIYTNDSARHNEDSREFQILEDLIYTQHTMMLEEAWRSKVNRHDLD